MKQKTPYIYCWRISCQTVTVCTVAPNSAGWILLWILFLVFFHTNPAFTLETRNARLCLFLAELAQVTGFVLTLSSRSTAEIKFNKDERRGGGGGWTFFQHVTVAVSAGGHILNRWFRPWRWNVLRLVHGSTRWVRYGLQNIKSQFLERLSAWTKKFNFF